MTAQKDNLLNHRMLQASKQDSADMRAMAEDSKIMTLATLQDSAEMRTIAAVTIFFLPGTATAVSNNESPRNFGVHHVLDGF